MWFGKKKSIATVRANDDKAGLRAFILELKPFNPHIITPSNQHEEYLSRTLIRNIDDFEVEHIFCHPLWDNPRLAAEVEIAGIGLMKAGNMVPLFKDEWLVDMINAEPAPHRFRNALVEAGWGTMVYVRGQTGSKLEEKSRFLIKEVMSVASSPSTVSKEAREIAILNLFDWTHKLLQGKIKFGNGA